MVETPRGKQFLGAKDAELLVEVLAQLVLPAVAARQRQVGCAITTAEREPRDELGVLIVRVRADVQHGAGGAQGAQLLQQGWDAGGLVGTGLGQGRPDLVPLAESDYIVASLGEELGLVGLFAILALYVLFVARAYRIGFSGTDDFGRMLAVGLGFLVALQVFVVIGGVTRVIPLTGLTTPFLAAGGSSLMANWIIAALLLRLSDSVRHQPRLVVDERE